MGNGLAVQHALPTRPLVDVPCAQATHAVAPALEKVFAGQAMHALAESMGLLNEPASHDTGVAYTQVLVKAVHFCPA